MTSFNHNPVIIDIISFGVSSDISEFEETTINTTLKVVAYYDKWEKENGDGFYPLWSYQDKDLCHWEKIYIYFTLLEEFDLETCKFCCIWKQITESCIDGIDDDSAEVLLYTLNTFITDKYKNNNSCEKKLGSIIQNKCGEILYSHH